MGEAWTVHGDWLAVRRFRVFLGLGDFSFFSPGEREREKREENTQGSGSGH